MKLTLKNNVTKQEIVLTGLTDIGTSALFYQFNIALPNTDILDGEYTYCLKEGQTELARGLVQIGQYTPEKTTYQKEHNGYITYNG